MTKKILAIVFLIFTLCTFCSCGRTTQMRDRAIIEAMAIDYKNGEYVVTLKEHLPSKEQGSQTENSYINSSGETLFDALKNAESNDGKQVFYGHSGVFLIGRSAAENGMDQIFEFMNSNYQLSLNSSVLVAQESAQDIIKAEGFSQSNADFSIERIQDCGKSLDMTVIDALKMSYNLEGQLYLPLISLDKEKALKIQNCVIFKDNKPITSLSLDETMGLNLLLGNVKDGVFVSKQDNERVSVNIVSQKSDLQFDTSDQEVTLNISVSAYGNVSELGVIGDENMRKEQLKSVQQDIETQIKRAIFKTLDKIVTRNNCDILYLKQRIKLEDSNLFKRIEKSSFAEVLSKMKFNVNVDFTVRHSGIQVK